MPSVRIGSNKYQFKNHWFDSTRVRTCVVQIPRSSRTGDRRFTHSATWSGVVCVLTYRCDLWADHAHEETIVSEVLIVGNCILEFNIIQTKLLTDLS